MDDGKTITVTLDPATTLALEAAVAAGEHPSVEAAALAAIDEWWADRAQESIGAERLREMLLESANSPGKDGEAVFAGLIAKYDALARTKGE